MAFTPPTEINVFPRISVGNNAMALFDDEVKLACAVISLLEALPLLLTKFAITFTGIL